MNRDEIERLVEGLEYLRGEALGKAEQFQQVEAFCLFVGYPKSGHSLLGSLLDAHPDMVIAHELDCLRCLRAGLGRELIFALILELAVDFRADGHVWNGYRYRVANQWQGRFRRLKVIGDKKGGGSSRLLGLYPRLLDRLFSTLALPVKFIHVVRDPLDNISSISREFEVALEDALALYFAMAEAVAALKPRLPAGSLCEVHYEDFAREPGWHLRDICRFLGQEATPDYLRDCAALVRPAVPRRAPWPPALLDRVRREAARFEFLAEYPLDP
jgi:hypothetical protein